MEYSFPRSTTTTPTLQERLLALTDPQLQSELVSARRRIDELRNFGQRARMLGYEAFIGDQVAVDLDAEIEWMLFLGAEYDRRRG